MPTDVKQSPLIFEHPGPHPSSIPATFDKQGNTPTQLSNYPVSEMAYKCIAMTIDKHIAMVLKDN